MSDARDLSQRIAHGVFLGIPLAAMALIAAGALGHLASAEGGESSTGHALSTLVTSMLQASTSTALACALGLPLGLALGRLSFPLKGALSALGAIPFVFPPLLYAMGFVKAMGAVAPGILYAPFAVVIAHGLYNAPLVAVFAARAFEALPASRVDAARMLGAGRLRRFLTIELPAATPSLAAGALLCFIYCLTSLLIPLIVGGLGAPETLETGIYMRIQGTSLDFRGAAIMAALQAGAASLALFAYARASRVSNKIAPRERFTALKHLSAIPPLPRIFASLGLAAGGLALSAPVLALPIAALSSRATQVRRLPGLDAGTIVSSLVDSVSLAVISASIAVALALAIALTGKRGGGSFLMGLPMIVSPSVLALGFMGLAPSGGGFPALAAAHALAFLPLAHKAVAPAAASLDPSLADSAAMLGAGPLRRLFTVILPLMLPSAGSAFALCAGLSLGEGSLVILLRDPDFTPLSLLVFRLFGSYRSDTAYALSSLLALLAIGFFLLSRAARSRDAFA